MYRVSDIRQLNLRIDKIGSRARIASPVYAVQVIYPRVKITFCRVLSTQAVDQIK